MGSETREVKSLILAVWRIMALADWKGCAKQLYPFGARLMAVRVVHMNNGALCLISFFLFFFAVACSLNISHATVSIVVQLI